MWNGYVILFSYQFYEKLRSPQSVSLLRHTIRSTRQKKKQPSHSFWNQFLAWPNRNYKLVRNSRQHNCTISMWFSSKFIVIFIVKFLLLIRKIDFPFVISTLRVSCVYEPNIEIEWILPLAIFYILNFVDDVNRFKFNWSRQQTYIRTCNDCYK